MEPNYLDILEIIRELQGIEGLDNKSYEELGKLNAIVCTYSNEYAERLN